MHCWPFQQKVFAFQLLSIVSPIVKFQMTADQCLYVKVLNNVNIYQIDEFFSGNIKNTIRSIRKSSILFQEV